jgi:hypothetical protein
VITDPAQELDHIATAPAADRTPAPTLWHTPVSGESNGVIATRAPIGTRIVRTGCGQGCARIQADCPQSHARGSRAAQVRRYSRASSLRTSVVVNPGFGDDRVRAGANRSKGAPRCDALHRTPPSGTPSE